MQKPSVPCNFYRVKFTPSQIWERTPTVQHHKSKMAHCCFKETSYKMWNKMVRPCLASDPQSQLVVEVMQRPHCGHSVPPSVGQDTLRRWLQSLIQDTLGVDQRRSRYTALHIILHRSTLCHWFIVLLTLTLIYDTPILHFVTRCHLEKVKIHCVADYNLWYRIYH